MVSVFNIVLYGLAFIGVVFGLQLLMSRFMPPSSDSAGTKKESLAGPDDESNLLSPNPTESVQVAPASPAPPPASTEDDLKNKT